MVAIVNTDQARTWNGREGRHWADERARYEAVNDAMNQPLLDAAAIMPTSRVLDIGCGTGHTTRLAARRAARATATGIDLSAPMLAAARLAAAEDGIANVSFELGDAQVHPFSDGMFDIAISRGGIMFFADPIAAFANIARALRPGGRLVFVCPQDLTPTADLSRALDPLWSLVPRATPWGWAAQEHSTTWLAEPGVIRHVLADAGFTDVTSTPVITPTVFGRDAEDATEFFFAMAPTCSHLVHANRSITARAHAEVVENLRRFQTNAGVVLCTELWLVHAIRATRHGAD